jgi:hypothetical protein
MKEKRMISMKDITGSLPSAEEIIRALGLEGTRRAPNHDLMPSVVLFGAGILVGAGLALLFAPTSGQELREQLAQKAADLSGQTGNAVGLGGEDADRDIASTH